MMLIVSVIIFVFINVNFVVIQNVSASLCPSVPFASKSGGHAPAPMGAPPMTVTHKNCEVNFFEIVNDFPVFFSFIFPHIVYL